MEDKEQTSYQNCLDIHGIEGNRSPIECLCIAGTLKDQWPYV